MHVTILTIGSRGDVQPYVALGKGLRAAGFAVRIATHRPFEPFIKSHSLDFLPVAGDPQTLLHGEAGRSMLESGRSSYQFLVNLKRAVDDIVPDVLADCLAACRNTDVVLHGVLGFPAYHAAERTGIRAIPALLQPIIRTGAYPQISAPPWLRLGRAFNMATHLLTEQLFWQSVRRIMNRWRRDMGLSPAHFWGPYGEYAREGQFVLLGYSPVVVPRPADWSANIQLHGYWFLDEPPDWSPPAGLQDFLDSGTPPIYIGFGSMTNRDPEAVTAIALDALRMTGRRGVLLSGWGGLTNADLPDEVFKIDAAPHAWLFPRMAAIVHHGGAGTTAAALRSGVPSIVVPFFGDQPFWGERVYRLGAGPRPIGRRRLNANRLAAAIVAAVGSPDIRARAAQVGQQIRSEDGVKYSVLALQDHLRQEGLYSESGNRPVRAASTAP